MNSHARLFYALSHWLSHLQRSTVGPIPVIPARRWRVQRLPFSTVSYWHNLVCLLICARHCSGMSHHNFIIYPSILAEPHCKDVELRSDSGVRRRSADAGSTKFRRYFMSAASPPIFKPPPIVECIAEGYCLGTGKKVYHPEKVCETCLNRYDCQQLRKWASLNTLALAIIEEEYNRRQIRKDNIESHNCYLCAFEDPDFEHCRWRQLDFNLRGIRLDCKTVRHKGKACSKCWGRRIRKIGVLQYFTPTALCHEELERAVTRSEDTGGGAEEEEDDDVEGYNIVFD
jgi:hypothetical protein